MVVHRSRCNDGLDIQPDMIFVRFLCFRPNWVLIQTEGESLFLYYLISLGLVDWTLLYLEWCCQRFRAVSRFCWIAKVVQLRTLGCGGEQHSF